MRNDDVITVMSHHYLMIISSYVRYINIHILFKFQPFFYRLKWLSYSGKTEISDYKKVT